MQHILESHDLVKCHTHFWPQPPKIIKVIFSFPEFVSTHHKSVYSINFLLRYIQPILESCEPRVATPILDHTLPQNISINF